MDEFEKIEDPDVVSQGDVIEWSGENRASPWHTFGVVVTADCDLFRDKHDGFISYVPAWVTEDFLWYQWRPSILESARNKQLDIVATRISTWRQKAGAGGVTSDAVRDWLRRAGPDKMLEELGVTDKGQLNTLLGVIKPAYEIDQTLEADAMDLPALLKAFCYARSKQGGDFEWFASELQKQWKSLPGDIFHLPSMPDGNPGDLFLRLRHIRQIRAEELTARPDDVRSGKAKAKRIARVTAPYRYAITQNLGKVFSDIGLPEAYETRRSTTAKRFFEASVKK